MSDDNPRLSRPLVDGALELAAVDLPMTRDFYGYAGGGPLTVSLSDDTVHIGWGTAGMFLLPHQARALARFLADVAREAG